MFFYASLFIGCAIAALLAIYLYKTITNLGEAFYRGLLPSSKSNVTDHLSRTRSYSTRNNTPAPWGWKGSNGKIREHGPNTASANGSSGIGAFINDPGKQSASVGWPYREEKTRVAGSSYKVSRKARSAKTGQGSGSKPWGW